MQLQEHSLTNHEVTVCLDGGAVLGPFHATWSRDSKSDVRELTKDYDRFMHGEVQTRFKYHLHDTYSNNVHTLFLRFENVTAIYDNVRLLSEP
jgi:hypothetical protein